MPCSLAKFSIWYLEGFGEKKVMIKPAITNPIPMPNKIWLYFNIIALTFSNLELIVPHPSLF